MTYEQKRDHFAALAMQGMLSACTGYNDNPSQLMRLSCSAYQYADAMLKAREYSQDQLKNWGK